VCTATDGWRLTAEGGSRVARVGKGATWERGDFFVRILGKKGEGQIKVLLQGKEGVSEGGRGDEVLGASKRENNRDINLNTQLREGGEFQGRKKAILLHRRVCGRRQTKKTGRKEINERSKEKASHTVSAPRLGTLRPKDGRTPRNSNDV